MVIIVHHIAIDLWSLMLILSSFTDSYKASLPTSTSVTSQSYNREPPIKSEIEQQVPYMYEYTRWQQQLLESSTGVQLANYWEEKLSGSLPVLDFPSDYPRPKIQTFHGSAVHFTISSKSLNEATEFARQYGTTLYTVLLSAYEVFSLSNGSVICVDSTSLLPSHNQTIVHTLTSISQLLICADSGSASPIHASRGYSCWNPNGM